VTPNACCNAWVVACGVVEQWGPFQVKANPETGTKRIVLPNGIQLIYDTLEFFTDPDDGDRYWRLKTRKGWVKLYGAKLVENLIQALARVVVSQAMIRLKKRGYRCKNTKHDSLWLLIPKMVNWKSTSG
jgi:DNA polymerase bacteriophage-type